MPQDETKPTPAFAAPGLPAANQTPIPGPPAGAAAAFVDDGPAPLDDDLSVVAPEGTPMDDVVARLTASVASRELAWKVPARPGFALLLRCNVSADHLRQFTERSAVKSMSKVQSRGAGSAPSTDVAKLACLLIGEYCTAVLDMSADPAQAVLRSHLLTGAPAMPATFRDREFLALYDAKTRVEGVRNFFTREQVIDGKTVKIPDDGPLVAMMTELLDESGLASSPEEADPAGPTD